MNPPEHPTSSQTPPALPLVCQIGFAGTRHVHPHPTQPNRDAFDAALRRQLRDALLQLPELLGLSSQHFMVGLSQMAAGADMLFTETAAELGWKQRVFLPQSRQDFLTATGSCGPDFSPSDQSRALALLQSDHIIEESVASTSGCRQERFEDTNLKLMSEADALVCIRRDDLADRPGGTGMIIRKAQSKGLAILELRLSVDDEGMPALKPLWHPPSDPTRLQALVLPDWTHDAPTLICPDGAWLSPDDYAQAFKKLCSAQAQHRRQDFNRGALVIVATHLTATTLAAMTLGHLVHGWLVYAALALEIMLLSWGLLTHHRLHHRHHTAQWAMARLCAEVCRSVRAFGRVGSSLGYLQTLNMPAELRPILRTFNVLHLVSVKAKPDQDWASEVKRYLHDRLDHPDPRLGQVKYFEQQRAGAQRMVNWMSRLFLCMTVAALAATAIKLALKWQHVAESAHGWLGFFAVVLPVAAVGAMSLAAAWDAEARAHTFARMKGYLLQQAEQLRRAESRRESALLAEETERQLLNETLTWFSRRTFTGIA